MKVKSSSFSSKVQSFFVIILALSVAISIYFFLKGESAKYEDSTSRTDAYFVIRQIPQGTSISDVLTLGYVESKEVLKESLPATAFLATVASNSPQLFAQSDINVGQILLKSDFGELQASSSGLFINDAEVAVSIRVGDVERVSPFLRPGNEVAIFATDQDSGGPKTRVLLSRVKVIGIGDSRFIGRQEYLTSGDPSIITLAVMDSDAAKVIQGSKNSSLNIVILGPKANVSPALVTDAKK